MNAKLAEREGRLHLIGFKQDITSERVMLDRLRRQAERDELTGLANRNTFEQRLRSALAGEQGQDVGALVLVDLDDFKKINDTYGHAAGDAVLAEAARRLSTTFRNAVTVARVGGDELAIVIPSPIDLASVEQQLDGAASWLKQPVVWQHRPIPVSASIGAALAGRRPSRSGLFIAADEALYAAKAAGRGTYRISADPVRTAA